MVQPRLSGRGERLARGLWAKITTKPLLWCVRQPIDRGTPRLHRLHHPDARAVTPHTGTLAAVWGYFSTPTILIPTQSGGFASVWGYSCVAIRVMGQNASGCAIRWRPDVVRRWGIWSTPVSCLLGDAERLALAREHIPWSACGADAQGACRPSVSCWLCFRACLRLFAAAIVCHGCQPDLSVRVSASLGVRIYPLSCTTGRYACISRLGL